MWWHQGRGLSLPAEGRRYPLVMGHCEVPADHSAVKDCHRLVAGGCRDMLGGGQPLWLAV